VNWDWGLSKPPNQSWKVNEKMAKYSVLRKDITIPQTHLVFTFYPDQAVIIDDTVDYANKQAIGYFKGQPDKFVVRELCLSEKPNIFYLEYVKKLVEKTKKVKKPVKTSGSKKKEARK